MTDHDRVLVRVEGVVGRLTLHRPTALNVLDRAMVRRLRAALDSWRHDDSIRTVLIDGTGDRAFCAGGDVRSLRTDILSGDLEAVSGFLREEYDLDLTIAEYPKPVVAIADGVTMGGGVGLACHASTRVVTERSVLAMPEVRIGFTPDVGGSLLLARAPGHIGEYLALTGLGIGAVDAVEIGWADAIVGSHSLATLRSALARGADPETALDEASRTAGVPAHAAASAAALGGQTWIDEVFSAPTVGEIVERLEVLQDPVARDALGEVRGASPLALAVALESVRRSRATDELRAALRQEYGLVLWFAATRTDMPEGIRARLVDRDGAPRWNPARGRDVTPELLAEAWEFTPEPALVLTSGGLGTIGEGER